jgi:hypothetical protein
VSKATGALFVVLAISAVAVWVALLSQLLGSSSGPGGSSSIADASRGVATAAPTARRSSTPAPSPRASRSAAPSTTATSGPRATGDPRLAWAAFLAHLDDARQTAQQLSDDLRQTGESGDTAGVVKAAHDIQALATRERRWLKDHPPADCYADVHTATGDLIDAYDEVARLALVWTEATGLGVFGALQDLAAAVQAAGAAATTVGDAAAATTCGA